MVEYLTPDQGIAGLSLTSVTALYPSARHINPCLILVQPRKTCPEITEKLLTGMKKPNQTNRELNYDDFVGQVNKISFFFLSQKKWDQVGQVGHGIFTALLEYC